MLRKMKAGETSQSIPIFVQDTSSSTGAGLGSLVYNTASLAAKYRRQGETSWTTITLATMTVGTWATGGFVADGGPVTGGYEFGVPNACIAAGVEWVEIMIYGAANMLPVLIFIELDAVNYQSATAFITGVNSLAPPSNWNLMAVDASGRVNAFLIGILTSVFTEGAAGRIAAAFKQFFNIASPAATMDHGILVDTVTTYTGNTPQTGDAYARLGAPAGASVSADVAAVKSDTGNLVTRITSSLFTGITSLAQWLGMLAGKQTGDSTARTELRATGAGSGTFDETTDSLEAIKDSAAGSAPSAADIADAVWDEALAGHSGAGTAGKALSDAAIGSAPTFTVADIADAVWDEQLSAHQDAGSTGEALGAAGSAGDPWTTALPGSYSAGQAGKIVGDNLNATVGSRATQTSVDTIDDFLDTEIADIKAKTDNLPADPADASDISTSFAGVNTKLDTIDDFLDTEIAAIKAKTDNLPADPADASDISTAFAGVNTKLDTIDDFLDTEVAAIKAVTDKVDTALVQDGGVYQFTANALELAPTGGSAPTAAAIADAVWDEALSGHAIAGSAGEALTDAQAGGGGGGSAPTAAENAAAVWDELLSGHSVSGSAGEILAALGTGGISEETITAIATKCWTVVDIIDTRSPQEIMRGLAASQMGKVTVEATGNPDEVLVSIYALDVEGGDEGALRWQAVCDTSGNRTPSVLGLGA